MRSATMSLTPWYREPWPWILMAGPFLVVVAAFVTLWLAISTMDGLVADDYYTEGNAVNADLARDRVAAKLGLSATVQVAGGHVDLALRATDPALLPKVLWLRVAHPTQGGLDRSVTLTRGNDGHYGADMADLGPVHWQMLLEDGAHTWRLVGQRLGPTGPVSLHPAS